MAKGQKSSATSATRKKHSRKTAGNAPPELPLPKEKEKKKEKGKGKKNEPRVKVYIPPRKPAPVRPEPLDSLGIAKFLPPELLIVLRRLAKKDSVTKRKALEEFQSYWIDKIRLREDENGLVDNTLQTAFPVWIHHFPSLFLSPSRRIRSLAVTIHTSLLRIPSILEQMISFLQESGDATQVESVIGSWALAAEDLDRAVSQQAKLSWNLAFRSPSSSNIGVLLNDSLLTPLFSFVKTSLLDPVGLYLDLNPVQPTLIATPPVHASPRNKVAVKRPPPAIDEAALSRKPEEDEESELDRKGRLRTGGLGVVKWMLEEEQIQMHEGLSELLMLPFFWTSLYYGASPPFCTVQHSSGFIGEGQPTVRKAAWNVLRSLLRFRGEYLERSLLPILSSAVLRSAWVELDASVQSSMWEPLLKYLTKFPDAWIIDQASSESGVQKESEGDSDEDSSDERKKNGAGGSLSVARSEAFQEFLSFLALGCNGSPIQSYPTIVVVLSTIPPSILGRGPDAWTDLLTSFWAALDGKALTSTASERAVASTAFLNALSECLVFLVKRSRAFPPEDTPEDNVLMQQEAVKTVVGQQMSRVWEELVNERLKVQSDAASGLLARTFTGFGKLNDSLFSASWDPIVSSFTAAYSPEHCEAFPAASKRLVLQLTILDGLWKESRLTQDTTWSRALTTLIYTVTSVFVEQVKEHFENTSKSKTRFSEVYAIQQLAEMLSRFGSAIFDNTELSSRIMALLDQDIAHILQSEGSIQLLLAFLWFHKDEDACISLWHNTLHTIASDVTLQEEDTLRLLLSAIEAKNFPEYLWARDDEMHQVANKLVEALLESREDRESLRTIVQKMLNKPHLFFSSRTASGLLCRVAAAFCERSKALMHAEAPDSLSPLRTPLLLINAVIETRPTHMFNDIRASLPDFFIFGYILPRTELLSSEARALCSLSRQVWSYATSLARSPHELDAIVGCLRSHLSDMIADVDSRASPEVILQVFAEENLGAAASVLQDLFPSQHALGAMLRELPSTPLHPTLAIVDPLVPPPSMWQGGRLNEKIQTYAYDRSGLSKFARIVNGLLLAVAENRDLIRQNIWLLRYYLVLSIAAREKLAVPPVSSAFFSNDVPAETLQDLHSRVMTLTTVVVSNISDEDWHVNLIQKYLNGSFAKGSSDDQSLSRFLFDMLDSAKRNATLQDARVLHALLQRLLNNATAADAEQWMILAKRLESQSRTATFAIVRAVNESDLEPPSLNRCRNEVAARALSIGGPKANTDGLAVLHSLALMAPDLESDIVFLPQNRAVNLMKAFQGWISSDEDIIEDVECELTLVFQHVAPILQDIPGSHWDFIFDTIENNLENVSFSDPTNLVSFARTLKLIIIIKDLIITNKSLRAVWSDRAHAMLALTRDIVQNTRVDNSANSVPKTICWEMALSVIHDLPSSLLDQESLGKMSHLIIDSSPEATKMAYSLLFSAAQKRSEYLVVEAGVDASADTAKYGIPAELLNVVQTALDSGINASPNVFGYLLGWMVIFDLFDNASLLVKIGYATQLRDLDLFRSSFLPFIFELLEVYGGRARSFVLEPWSVDEYYIQFYDPESRSSPRLLAAHLYYRALLNVPSFISNWWASCRDRQLSTAVASLTMKYYSPVLIAAELRHIRDPVVATELPGDNWSIKVAAGVGEVGAAYTVDEQVMEIAIRLPPDYPLHGIEVREVQKLGVEENRWRGWLLAVQQIVSSQNGRIVDGLSMFKKNVTHHFENQTECAICYSIISVTELSLPKKRCKTCKNRFHAGCLFKWFNTSHTSSCPLCRSDFI